jgi:hypothetical protein
MKRSYFLRLAWEGGAERTTAVDDDDGSTTGRHGELRHQKRTCTEPQKLWRLKPSLPEVATVLYYSCGEVSSAPIHLKGGGERIRPTEATRKPNR